MLYALSLLGPPSHFSIIHAVLELVPSFIYHQNARSSSCLPFWGRRDYYWAARARLVELLIILDFECFELTYYDIAGNIPRPIDVECLGA